MTPDVAANYTIQKITGKPELGDIGRSPVGVGSGHAIWMLDGIQKGYIQREKAHRWLGYAQALLVSGGILTLDEVKTINREAS